MKHALTAEAPSFMQKLDGTEIRHPRLKRCGLFKSYTGLYGRGPIQFEAYLTTGEYVYFKARENKVEMYILRSHEDLAEDELHLGHIRKQVPRDAGAMDAVLAVQHIINLTREYIQKRDAANPVKKERAMKKPKTTDRPIRLANPKIISEGPIPGTIVLNFSHHPQCACKVCLKKNVTRKPGRRNGSR